MNWPDAYADARAQALHPGNVRQLNLHDRLSEFLELKLTANLKSRRFEMQPLVGKGFANPKRTSTSPREKRVLR